MSAVTNQLPYTEIKILPISKEVCPNLRMLIERVTLLIAIAGFTTGFGIAIGLSNFSISVMTGALVGCAVGSVIGLSLAFFMHFPTKVIQYHLDILKKIKETLGNPGALRAINALEEFYYYPFTKIWHTYDHHTLHKYLSSVTDHLDVERKDARQAWGAFLQHLNETALVYPDGNIFPFKTEEQMKRLLGSPISVERNWLSSWSGTYEKDLEQIEEISRLGFGNEDMIPASRREAILSEDKPSGCILARNAETKEILGCCWYYTENGVVRIGELARKPEAARLGIGVELLYEVIKANRNRPLQMVIREGHPFIKELRGFGFTQKETFSKYFYEPPAENGVLMEMDWKLHARKFNGQ